MNSAIRYVVEIADGLPRLQNHQERLRGNIENLTTIIANHYYPDGAAFKVIVERLADDKVIVSADELMRLQARANLP